MLSSVTRTFLSSLSDVPNLGAAESLARAQNSPEQFLKRDMSGQTRDRQGKVLW